jgi:hypothetical protein
MKIEEVTEPEVSSPMCPDIQRVASEWFFLARPEERLIYIIHIYEIGRKQMRLGLETWRK